MTEPVPIEHIAPTKHDVLAAIDWELSVLAERRKILGATAWTLTVGLGATLWLLFSRQHSWAELSHFCFLLFGLSLLYDFLLGIFITLEGFFKPAPVTGFLFSLARRFGPLHRFLTLQILTTVLLVACLWGARSEVRQPLFVVLFSILGFRLVLLLLASAVARWPAFVEDKDDDQPRKLQGPLAKAVLFMFGVVPTLWFWGEFLRTKPTVSLDTFHSAALVCVARLLIDLLIVCQMPTTLIVTLQGLRRGLALDLLSISDAKAQLQIALVGVRRDELLQEKLAELISCYQPSLSALDESIRWLAQQKAEVTAQPGWTPEAIEAKRALLRKELDAQSERIHNAFEQVRKTDMALGRRIHLRYGSAVGDELSKAARQYFEQLKARAAARSEIAQAIKQVLASARTQDPTTSAPVTAPQ